MAQPLLIGRLLAYYDPDQTNITIDQAYLNAFGIIFLSFINVMILHTCFFGLQHASMRIRVACCSLIYRKVLKLDSTDTTIGQIVTLMSNDVSRFDNLILRLHHLISAPLQVIVVLYLLYTTMDSAALAGIAVLSAVIPIQFFTAKKTSGYRLKTALKSDHRVKLINEIINGIKVIKMHTWEKSFSKLVTKARELELKWIKSNAYLKAIHLAIAMFLIRSAIFVCILTYVFKGNVLKAEFVYVVTSYYTTVRQPLTLHLPRCIATFAETRISLKRIQDFLSFSEINFKPAFSDSDKSSVGISMSNASVKWNESSSDCTLKNVSLTFGPKQLVAIIGPVGSGKSTLLQTILREIPVVEGTLDVKGRISLAAQEPWLFSSSIRQNILFGEKMDFVKYNQVVKVCALEKDFSMFPYGDKTIVGERGIMLSGGQKARITLARAIYKDADIYLLDDPLSAVDPHVGKQLFNECILKYLKDKCTVLVTHQLQYLNAVDKIYLLENGSISASGTFNELQNSDSEFLKLLTESEQERVKEVIETNGTVISSENTRSPTKIREQRGTGKLSNRIYWKYFRAGGSYILPVFIIIFFIITQLMASSADYFVTFWVNTEQRKIEEQLTVQNDTETKRTIYETLLNFSLNDFVYTYSSIIGLLIIVAVISSFNFVSYCVKASKNLHDRMFSRVLSTTMRFFYTNPSGRILNRFSKDIGTIDEILPISLIDTINVGLNVIAIAMILSSINLWIIIPTCLVFGIFYFYRLVYMATSRDLKRLEGTTRSPVYSHLTASLQGLPVIRAFGAQNILMTEFDRHQDLNSSTVYLFRSCSRTFAIWMDITCVIYIGLVILSFLFFGTETYGGNVGLAITQSITLTGMLQRGIRQWSELENQMTSVERVIEYTDLPSEPSEEKVTPPKEWPNEGRVEFQSLWMRYSSDDPYVLKNLKFSIKSKEKIGIVGRTGAGKSSLISAIFRLAQVEGKIIIDGININEISLESLRSRISIIPQEPVLFSESLRKNLDPFEEYSDSSLWNALEEVELKSFVSSLPSGLHMRVSESGSNFSVGQKQLLCLARAILCDNKILILDEATANVDPQTDELIQDTIKRKFKDCTVLTIAHRIHTVMNSDKILCMDSGVMVEFDHPRVLLKNENGLFYKLVIQTDKNLIDNLGKDDNKKNL